jgi:hypothetical protein
MERWALLVAFSSILSSAFSLLSQCQTTVPENQAPPVQQMNQPSAKNGRGQFGVGVKVSSLGLGIEAAVRVSERGNLRAGFNVLGWSHTFTKDGIAYDGHLNFKTLEAHYDFFPWAGNFHVSPGLLAYTADPIKANAVVPGDKSFTVGGVTFYSDPAKPATARGRITFSRVAPIITVGWGNLISRKEGSRFSFPFEVGIALQGRPNTTMVFGGNVCTSPGVNCTSADSNAEVQRNLVSEQRKINNSLSLLKVYPIISSGFGVRF